MGNLVWIDVAIIVSYALLGIATLGAVMAGVRSLVANPQGAKRVLIGLVGIAAVIGIAFALSTDTGVSEVLLERTETAAWVVRPVGAGLISFYILFGFAFLSLIGTEIWRPFKK
jgi:hypothetical protein